MKKNWIIIILAMLAISSTASAQFDIEKRIQQQIQRELDKKKPKIPPSIINQGNFIKDSIKNPDLKILTPKIPVQTDKSFYERIRIKQQNAKMWENDSLKDRDFVKWRHRWMITNRQFNIPIKSPNFFTTYTMMSLFNKFSLSRNYPPEMSRKDVLFISVYSELLDILKLYKNKHTTETNIPIVPIKGMNKGIIVTKIPSNTEKLSSIIFIAHTDVDSVSTEDSSIINRVLIHYNNKGKSIKLKNGNIINRLDASSSKKKDPYKGRAITMFSTDGESPIGVEGVCSSVILVELCAQIALNDTLKHGDVYFCLFKNKEEMYDPAVLAHLDTVAMGSDCTNVMVYLNGGKYASFANNSVNKDRISKMMQKALKCSKLSWNSGTSDSEFNNVNIPVIQLYCGMHNPGTLTEWACLEDMMDAVRLGRSMVSNIKEIGPKD